MSVAGDCRLMISHVHSANEWEKYREQIRTSSSSDEEIQRVIDPSVIEESSKGERNPFDVTKDIRFL